MTSNARARIHIALAVATHEAQAVEAGIRLAVSYVNQLSSGRYDLELCHHDREAQIRALPTLDCVLISAANDQPDIAVEDIAQIWADRVQALTQSGAVIMMLNQFRCVDRKIADRSECLFRIRDLNRRQITLAQKHDMVIVDIDSILADLGGLNLNCDYRLQSEMGSDAVAKTLAQAMLTSGLRNVIEKRVLDEALKLLGGIVEWRSALAEWRAAFGSIRSSGAGAMHG